MSGTISTYLQAARCNWYKGTTYPAAPTNVYCALFTTMPTQAGSGGVEVSGTGYARVSISASTGWGAITGSGPWQIATAGLTSFGTSGSAWGTILGFGLYDASTSGNLLAICTFAQSVTVSSNQAVSFATGNITISDSGSLQTSQYKADANLNWYKGTTYPAAPANTYVALFTVMPNAAGSGGTEASGGSYARAAIASSGWSVLTGTNPTTISNSGSVSFTTPTASWGTIVGIGLYDASSNGNLLALYTLGASQYVNSGASVSFSGSTLTITED